MELRTNALTAIQWESEVDNLICFLQSEGKHELIVFYGWGCDLDVDDLYQEVPLPLSELRTWLAQSIEAGIFTFGESNLHILSGDREVELELGHEHDIHLTTENEALAQEVAAAWTQRGYAPYQISLKQ